LNTAQSVPLSNDDLPGNVPGREMISDPTIGVLTMRKFLLSLSCLLLLAGVTYAADAVFVKFDSEKKELTVKEGDKDNVYKITDKTKVSIVDKDGNATAGELKLLEKAKSGKTKIEILTDKDIVTEIKMKKKK